VSAKGEQGQAVNAYLGQVVKPSNFKIDYNAKKDNRLPDESLKMNHVFGLRNLYINDEVRNQVKFSSTYREVLFPAACLGIKMNLKDKKQTFYHEHKEDIVSFAVDPTRKLMATGQMAQKNAASPRKKIVSIYVWDVS